ncbi:hypothetical protein QE392_001239 [Microbacterium proteolyticum]|nr:hypothetical protein [Microbacterium proteolyticum]
MEERPLMVQRQLPKVGEFLELMQFKKPELDARKRRLDAALTIADLRAIAKRRTPKAAFDYTDGAAEWESCRSLVRGGRSRTWSSTPTSCDRRRSSTPRARSSAARRRCRSASRRPASRV